jgi:hypothetical protein
LQSHRLQLLHCLHLLQLHLLLHLRHLHLVGLELCSYHLRLLASSLTCSLTRHLTGCHHLAGSRQCSGHLRLPRHLALSWHLARHRLRHLSWRGHCRLCWWIRSFTLGLD